MDSVALVGRRVAEKQLDFEGYSTTISTRADESAVTEVQGVLGATANLESPGEVDVSRPSDALAAKEATDDALSGAGTVRRGAACLRCGVADTVIISVLERRAEIGLRRSLGATLGRIRTQFLSEALLLSALGGVGATLVIGGLVGLCPVVRAARLPGTEALAAHWTAVLLTKCPRGQEQPTATRSRCARRWVHGWRRPTRQPVLAQRAFCLADSCECGPAMPGTVRRPVASRGARCGVAGAG